MLHIYGGLIILTRSICDDVMIFLLSEHSSFCQWCILSINLSIFVHANDVFATNLSILVHTNDAIATNLSILVGWSIFCTVSSWWLILCSELLVAFVQWPCWSEVGSLVQWALLCSEDDSLVAPFVYNNSCLHFVQLISSCTLLCSWLAPLIC